MRNMNKYIYDFNRRNINRVNCYVVIWVFQEVDFKMEYVVCFLGSVFGINIFVCGEGEVGKK